MMKTSVVLLSLFTILTSSQVNAGIKKSTSGNDFYDNLPNDSQRCDPSSCRELFKPQLCKQSFGTTNRVMDTISKCVKKCVKRSKSMMGSPSEDLNARLRGGREVSCQPKNQTSYYISDIKIRSFQRQTAPSFQLQRRRQFKVDMRVKLSSSCFQCEIGQLLDRRYKNEQEQLEDMFASMNNMVMGNVKKHYGKSFLSPGLLPVPVPPLIDSFVPPIIKSNIWDTFNPFKFLSSMTSDSGPDLGLFSIAKSSIFKIIFKWIAALVEFITIAINYSRESKVPLPHQLNMANYRNMSRTGIFFPPLLPPIPGIEVKVDSEKLPKLPVITAKRGFVHPINTHTCKSGDYTFVIRPHTVLVSAVYTVVFETNEEGSFQLERSKTVVKKLSKVTSSGSICREAQRSLVREYSKEYLQRQQIADDVFQNTEDHMKALLEGFRRYCEQYTYPNQDDPNINLNNIKYLNG